MSRCGLLTPNTLALLDTGPCGPSMTVAFLSDRPWISLPNLAWRKTSVIAAVWFAYGGVFPPRCIAGTNQRGLRLGCLCGQRSKLANSRVGGGDRHFPCSLAMSREPGGQTSGRASLVNTTHRFAMMRLRAGLRAGNDPHGKRAKLTATNLSDRHGTSSKMRDVPEVLPAR